MRWTLRYLPSKAVLLARTEGDYEPEPAALFVQALGVAHQQHLPQLLLIDRRLSELRFDKLSIYRHPAVFGQAGIPPGVTVVLVVAERTADEHFLEFIFLSRGYGIKVFEDWRRAVAWIAGFHPPT